MIVHPRIEWTTTPTKVVMGADPYTGLPYFRKNEVAGIKFYSPTSTRRYLDSNPSDIWKELHQEALNVGLSDTAYSLGVAGNVSGVWNLRGLHNKPASSNLHLINNSFISVYLAIGAEEKPTDTLLRNVLATRRLVVSRYPTANLLDSEEVNNPWLQVLFGKESFWRQRLLAEEDDYFTDALPVGELEVGQSSVHVQDLQEQLSYWGYFKTRVNAEYNVQTADAVTELQADLKDGGFYHYDLDGKYSDHLHRAWVKFLESVT